MNQQNEKHRQMKINEQQQQQNEQKWTKISGGSPKQVPSLGVFDYFMVIDVYVNNYLWLLWLFMIILWLLIIICNYKMIICDYFIIIY